MPPLKKPNSLRREIKIETKKHFKESGVLSFYKQRKSTTKDKMLIQYTKANANIHLLDSKLSVLFRKGLYKNSREAKRTIKKFKDIYDVSLDTFLKKSEVYVKQKTQYELYKNTRVSEHLLVSLTSRYSKTLNELVRKSNDIIFIEDLNPLLDKIKKDFFYLFKDRPKLN